MYIWCMCVSCDGGNATREVRKNNAHVGNHDDCPFTGSGVRVGPGKEWFVGKGCRTCWYQRLVIDDTTIDGNGSLLCHLTALLSTIPKATCLNIHSSALKTATKVDSWSLKSVNGLLLQHEVGLYWWFGRTVKIHHGKVVTFQTFKNDLKYKAKSKFEFYIVWNWMKQAIMPLLILLTMAILELGPTWFVGTRCGMRRFTRLVLVTVDGDEDGSQ